MPGYDERAESCGEAEISTRETEISTRETKINSVAGESADDICPRLSREMINAEREVFVRLRDQRRIDDETL